MKDFNLKCWLHYTFTPWVLDSDKTIHFLVCVYGYKLNKKTSPEQLFVVYLQISSFTKWQILKLWTLLKNFAFAECSNLSNWMQIERSSQSLVILTLKTIYGSRMLIFLSLLVIKPFEYSYLHGT